MRSMLESKILAQIARLDGYHFHLIAGNPAGIAPLHTPEHVTYATHANAIDLAAALSTAQLVICRSGYSTLMDLAMLGKKALLIPTPGQSEQEYLAEHLQAQGIALSRRQAEMDLEKDIIEALGYTGFGAVAHTGNPVQMQAVIDGALTRLKN